MVTQQAPLLNRGVLSCLAVDVTLNDAKARREIGYKNVITMEEGYEELRQAYVAQGVTVLDVLGKK